MNHFVVNLIPSLFSTLLWLTMYVCIKLIHIIVYACKARTCIIIHSCTCVVYTMYCILLEAVMGDVEMSTSTFPPSGRFPDIMLVQTSTDSPSVTEYESLVNDTTITEK